MSIWTSAGIFVYPLLICSILGVFVFLERLIALQPSKVMPKALVDAFMLGSVLKESTSGDLSQTAGGRIVHFFKQQQPDPEALKAFAHLEMARLEKGVFILEIVVGIAPLIGLLGTVTGLIQVFSNVSLETGLPDTQAFVQGIALALTTTMLGLGIAIPALAAHSYLLRRVECLSAQIHVGVERLIDLMEYAKP